MATTLATALAAVRVRLDEVDGAGATTNVAWKDSELRAWINEGCRDITRKTHCLFDRTTIAVVASTAEYTGPTDALAVDIVNYTPTGGQKHQLDYAHITNANGLQYFTGTAYMPQVWTLRGMPPTLKIVLYPTPSTNGTLEVFYTRLAAALSTTGSADSSNIEVPEGWEDLVYAYAEARARRKDRDQSWQEAQQEYDQNLQALMSIAGVYTHNTGQNFPGNANVPWYREW